jgi:hypothetical protein
VDEYREGKVKSTPMRGVKETLKPNAYEQSEVQRTVVRGQRTESSLFSVICPLG